MPAWIRRPVEALLALVTLFVIWELAVRIAHVPAFVLPPPSAVFEVAVATGPVLLQHALTTIGGTLTSLVAGAALGMGVGLLIGYFPALSRMLYSLLGGLQALPMSAFIPIFVSGSALARRRRFSPAR
jgi:NitT/TauT family transport system permease protein